MAAEKSVPPASKKVGREKFPSHLPRWDRFLAGKQAVLKTVFLAWYYRINFPL
jgi:hypothetical protein